MKNYIYGGYIETGGKFEDGRDWKSLILLLAPKFGNEPPHTAKAYKARAFLAPVVKQMNMGVTVTLQFDEQGKIIGLSVV